MSDPLTDAANAISTASPNVRAFAQLAAQRIIALEKPPASPAWPTPTKHLKAGDSFDALYPTLQGGDVIACESGVYPISAASHSKGGGNGNPIWFVPADPTKPPIFKGRFVTVPGGDDIRFTLAGFDGRNDTGAPSWTLGGARNEFDLCDFTNYHTGIGIHPVGAGAYGPASYVKVTRSRIHGIGRLPYGSTNNDHGLYDAGASHTHLADVMVYECSDRGLQLRGAKSALIEQVTLTRCGMGVIFGDIGAVGCVVRRCILTDNQVTSRFLIEEYDPAGHDSDNAVTDCFAFNRDGRSPGTGGHSVTITDLHRTDPQLNANLMPQAQAAAGYGCRVQPPRIVAAS